MDRLTKYEGYDPDGTPSVVMAHHDGNFSDNLQAVLRKLAAYEDAETEEGVADGRRGNAG